MQTVKVNRDRLLLEVKANRDKHQAVYQQACEGYRTKMIEELEKLLQKAKDSKVGEHISRHIQLPEPENHLDDYDRIISMLEMSIQVEIELNAVEFDQYVRDKWSWSHETMIKNMSYISMDK